MTEANGNDDQTPSVIFTCVKCGKKWGSGVDILTYGLCIECFAKWAEIKKECFGTSELLVFEDNKNCKLYKFCKEYYEFKQNLSR